MPLRVLHAPSNFADQAGIIVRALRALGHESELWQYGDSKWGFEADRTIDIDARDGRAQYAAFMEAIDRFDVFHFWYARSFFPSSHGGIPPFWDLPVLRALGKKIFFSYVGSEIRMRRVLAEYNPWTDLYYSDSTPDDDLIAKRMNLIRTYADKTFVIGHELTLHSPDSVFIPRAAELDDWPERAPRDREVPVVLHAPSRRSFKGTEHILAGLQRLKDDGVAFDLRLIENIPHNEMRAMMADADIVIDQVLCGDFGVTTVEAMLSGCAPVAFLLDEVVAASDGIPIYNVNVSSFDERMRALLTDRALRREFAGAGRAYVASHYDARTVAAEYVRHYEDEARAPSSRAFPDWLAFGDERKIEALEERVAALELQRSQAVQRAAKAEARSKELKEQLDAGERPASGRFVNAALRRARGPKR